MKLSITRSVFAAGLVLGLSAMTLAPVHAQGNSKEAATTRAQVKMDRDAFLAIARYDTATEMWVIRDDMAMPAGVLSRMEVKAMRDKFLSMHTWDDGNSRWIPVNGAPRDMSKLTRAQVQEETARFFKTMRYDDGMSSFVQR